MIPKAKKDWVTKAGFRAVIVKNRQKCFCGYVAVEPGHPLYGVGYREQFRAIKLLSEEEPIGGRGIMPLFRDLEFVTAQCESLAQQLIDRVNFEVPSGTQP
jgi:hypothetical protein